MWLVVVEHRVKVEEFSSVVCVIAGLLKPYRQVLFVKALLDELGISTY
jgi:hypothetical protein